MTNVALHAYTIDCPLTLFKHMRWVKEIVSMSEKVQRVRAFCTYMYRIGIRCSRTQSQNVDESS